MSIYRGAGGASDATDDSTVNAVAGYAASASTSASNAATSAGQAATSASASGTNAISAAASASNAATQASNAASSVTSAASAVTAATAQVTAATTQASAALNSASAASTSAAQANSSAIVATTQANASTSQAAIATAKASESATSATDSAVSASTSTTKASEAAASAVSSASSASAALNSANSASGSVSAVQVSANTATSAANTATTQATNASNSATLSAVSASSAAASAVSALSSAASAAAIVTGVASNRPSIRPSLLLDFANTRTLDPRITFTRASTATFYDDKTTVVAEQNLFVYSQALDIIANWLLLAASVTANSIAAPDGTTTAETLTADGTSNIHAIKQNTSASTVGKTVSIYAKSGTNQYLQILFDADAAPFANFDLTAGTVGTVGSGVTASIVSVGNSWYRCICTTTSTTATNAYFAQSNSSSAARYPTFVGSGTIYLWGAQLEQRSSATAYTPTTTAAITNYIPVLQTAASGVARFDCNPVTRESLGLLIEESRTNLLTYSSDFSNASWSAGNSTVVPASGIAPDGTQTFTFLKENTATASRSVSKSSTLASGTTSTWTVYAKSTDRSIYISATDQATGSFIVLFNLQNGSVISTTPSGSWSNVLGQIVSVGNGIYRCSVTATKGAGSGAVTYIGIATTAGATTYTGDGYSGIFIWGAQLEAGAFATSYIPTVASQVTRAADAASMTGVNFSSWYNQSQGSWYSQVSVSNVNNSRVIARSGSLMTPLFISSPSGSFGSYDGAAVVSAGSFSANTPIKGAASWAGTNAASVTNGGTVATGTQAIGYSAMTAINIGYADYSALYAINGTIKRIAYYPKALTSTELQGLTS